MKKYYKTLMSLMLIGVLALGSVLTADAAALPMYGDVNADGEINIDDVTEISKYLADITDFSDEQCILADYNGDGDIDIDDAIDIQKTIASLDYKYSHELYEVAKADFSSDELKSVEFKVDKCVRPYVNISGDYLYNGACYDHLRTVFKTYDEYSRFFKATFEEYNDEFFEENAIIFMYDFYTSGSIKDVLDNVYVNDNVLYLECTHIEPGEGEYYTDDLGIWNQFIVVDKSDVENIDSICVKYR